MGSNPKCTFAYGWLVECSVLDELIQALPPEANPLFFPEELWGWCEEVRAIGWEKKRIYHTEVLNLADLSTTDDDHTNLKLFREWLADNQSEWDDNTEEVFKMIMTTPPKLLVICDYS